MGTATTFSVLDQFRAITRRIVAKPDRRVPPTCMRFRGGDRPCPPHAPLRRRMAYPAVASARGPAPARRGAAPRLPGGFNLGKQQAAIAVAPIPPPRNKAGSRVGTAKIDRLGRGRYLPAKRLIYWLGRQDSNLGMTVPKTVALPLGDAPIAGSSAPRGRDHSRPLVRSQGTTCPARLASKKCQQEMPARDASPTCELPVANFPASMSPAPRQDDGRATRPETPNPSFRRVDTAAGMTQQFLQVAQPAPCWG